MELEPLHTLTEKKVTSTPRIWKYKATRQGPDGMVPGGFLHIVLMNHAPGEQLSPELFWRLPREERDQVRAAFRFAWECVFILQNSSG